MIEAKADYITHVLCEPVTAEKWYYRLRREIEEDLSFFPEKYPFKRVEKGIRQAVFRGDVVLYSVDHERAVVTVRTVCTRGQDIAARIKVL